MPLPPPSDDSDRLRRLDLRRVLGLGLGLAETAGFPSIPTAEELGALLPGYGVQAVIGRGGMGAVYRAVQHGLARAVAIKVLPVDLGDTPGFAGRFRQEAMTTAGLSHPDIVAVYDTGETLAGHLYYVMDLVDGEDLALRMARGRLPLEESVALLTTVCGAVEAAHAKGIIHRDIKPSNILLTKEGKPKLADFGLALLTEKHLEYSRLTLGGTTLGTLEYAAPEQLAGTGATMASDQYSLGVLAYELLTGELPRGVFEGPSARNAEIDPAFDGVVLRALQSDPARRYDSVAAFCTAILTAADRRVQQERRDGEARRTLRRRTLIAGVAACAALLTIGLAVFAWRQTQRAEAGESAAQTQRDAARLTRGEAEKLVEFMLIELQGRLFEVNRLDVLDDVVAKVRAYYDRVPAEESRADEFLLRKAEFLELRGTLAGKHGRRDEALTLYREAQHLRRDLLRRHPRGTLFFNGYAEGEFALAGALNNPAAAWQSHQNIIDAWVTCRGLPITEATEQMPLMSLALQAELLAGMHRPDEARAMAEALLARMETLLSQPEFSGEFGHQNVKAILLRVLAGDAGKRGQQARAADFEQRMMQLYEQFLPEEGRHGYREYMFAEAAKAAADRLLLAGRAAEAAAAAARGWAIASRLSQDTGADESSRTRTAALAASWQGARRAQQLPDDIPQLAAAAQEWLSSRQSASGIHEQELWAALTAQPEQDAAQYAWAMASEEAGKQIDSSRGPVAAREHYRTQLAKLEPLLAAAPAGSWWNLSASYTLNRLGDLHERTGDLPAAEAAYRRALSLRRAVLAAHSKNARERRNVASSATHLTRVLLARQRTPDAAALLRPLLVEMKPLPADVQTNWRALLTTAAADTCAALPAAEARPLAEDGRAFLLAHGATSLTAAEKEVLAALDQVATGK